MENKQYQNVTVLESAVIEAWESIDQNIWKTLIESISDRLFEFIQKKEGPTHY